MEFKEGDLVVYNNGDWKNLYCIILSKQAAFPEDYKVHMLNYEEVHKQVFEFPPINKGKTGACDAEFLTLINDSQREVIELLYATT